MAAWIKGWLQIKAMDLVPYKVSFLSILTPSTYGVTKIGNIFFQLNLFKVFFLHFYPQNLILKIKFKHLNILLRIFFFNEGEKVLNLSGIYFLSSIRSWITENNSHFCTCTLSKLLNLVLYFVNSNFSLIAQFSN